MFGKKITFINPRLAKAAQYGVENMILFRDHHGHEHMMSRQEWEEDYLPRMLQSAWNDPDQLACLIIHALKEEIYEEILDPAEHLYRIDRNTERSSSILVLLYLKLHRVKDVEEVLFQKMKGPREREIKLHQVIARW